MAVECVAEDSVAEDSDVSVASVASVVVVVVVVPVVISTTTVTTTGTVTNLQKKKWISIKTKCPCINYRQGTSLLAIILDKKSYIN
ncbi:hypothetical protein [Neobacillus cucumis]|uniref:hypothetical protein n=1 Tax=Neobacillus cucumis TaxID=1740721 RepID=UPI001E4AE0D1|nr:hypothetical protein [Neobacillus cucumis]